MDADRRRIVERDDPQLEMKGVPEDKEVLNKWVGINAAFEMDKTPVLGDFYQEAARTVAQEVFNCLIENSAKGD